MGIGEGDGEVDIEPYDEFEEQEIESGPFCRHFADPVDCDELCGNPACRHKCCEHEPQCGNDTGQCDVDNCTCTAWVD
jgi:hypothetical protein